MVQVGPTHQARRHQPVRTGVGDVPADRPADQGDHRQEVQTLRCDRSDQRLTDRRCGLDGDERNEGNLHNTEGDDRSVNRSLQRLVAEDNDREDGAEHRPESRIDTEQVMQAQPRARDVADAEHQTTEHDERSKDIPGAGENNVC